MQKWVADRIQKNDREAEASLIKNEICLWQISTLTFRHWRNISLQSHDGIQNLYLRSLPPSEEGGGPCEGTVEGEITDGIQNLYLRA